jgi:hypothetical protein
MLIDMSTVCPGATSLGTATDGGAPRASPPASISLYAAVQVQVPPFRILQVLVKGSDKCMIVLSGMLTSATKSAR